MVIKDDPTLMFTNAGMNQFKDIFLGNSTITDPRVANSQKCLRVSGKHNDLEEVGVDTYHHTMFEMLGNWSFGDYFKTEAIEWAWELLTVQYKLDPSKLYATVFEGDTSDGLKEDAEALNIWSKILPQEQILLCNKKDNFWEMGETGPCGPCSEIHIDLRSEEERKSVPGATLVNKDHPQVIEIWNLVFMQYNRLKDNSLIPLKETHIDTGMGLERLAMALQNKISNYDTDVFMPLIQKIEALSQLRYQTAKEKEDSKIASICTAMRVISDHVRAISFSIADGQLPSNTGAGYVIRRILRRAVRYGYQCLSLKTPFLYELTDILVEQMGEAFPELSQQRRLIKKVIKEEETSFFRTLASGLKRLDQQCANHKKKGEKIFTGKDAFELYDTYGFPIDLTHLIAKEHEMEVDVVGFEKELNKQKSRSKKAAATETEDWIVLKEDDVEEFIGYDYTESQVQLTRYRGVIAKGKKLYQLVFNYTPFYPEGGGQIGDQGHIEYNGEKVQIIDTKKENNLILHITEELPSELEAKFTAKVNHLKRSLTANNHTATHLLHAVLRNILGKHVEQKGSLVTDRNLRFDFSHFQKLTQDEIEKIEQEVNAQIRDNHTLEEHRSIPLIKAQGMGAMMLFGEKYGDVVRAIKFGQSIELCGGIHVTHTSQIGNFKIISEGSVAAGIRRIEAITSVEADKHLSSQLQQLDHLKTLLNNSKDPINALEELLTETIHLKKQVLIAKKAQAKDIKATLLQEAQLINGVNFVSANLELDNNSVKDLAYQLRDELENAFVIIGNQNEGKVLLTLIIADNLVKEKGYHAGSIIRELAKEIQGGGGGQPFFATAGGKNVEGINTALKKARKMLSDTLG